jgi:hypothetical protein
MWVGVADKERRGRLDDRIRERNSKRPLWPSLDTVERNAECGMWNTD